MRAVIVLSCLAGIATGCVEYTGQGQVHAPPTNVAPEAANPSPALGAVQPAPDGCISMTFYAPGDVSHEVRRPSGFIDAVILPSGRKAVVVSLLSASEVEELVYRIDDIIASDQLILLSHIPSSEDERVIPGPAAWEYLRPYLLPTDRIWTFDDESSGIVVLRDDHVYCTVVRTTLQPPS